MNIELKADKMVEIESIGVDQDKEFKWEENVSRAKQLYSGRNKMQMEIAKLAMEVCEITRGGSIHGLFTITKFAEESGISPKVLSNWMAVRKLVFNKIPPEKTYNSSYTDLAHVALRVKPNFTNSQVERKFDELMVNSVDKQMLKYIGALRSILANFRDKDAANKCQTKTLQEIKFYNNQIDKHLKDIKPENNGLAAANTIKNVSCINKALENNGYGFVIRNGSKVKINEKDKQVINILKRSKKFLSVREIVSSMGGNVKGGPEKCSAIRTIHKLNSLGYLKRNASRHYCWK